MEAGLEPKPDIEGRKHHLPVIVAHLTPQHYYTSFKLLVRLAQPYPVRIRDHFFVPSNSIVTADRPETGHNDTASSVLGCAAKVILLIIFVCDMVHHS
jgi:hypothetical protein